MSELRVVRREDWRWNETPEVRGVRPALEVRCTSCALWFPVWNPHRGHGVDEAGAISPPARCPHRSCSSTEWRFLEGWDRGGLPRLVPAYGRVNL